MVKRLSKNCLFCIMFGYVITPTRNFSPPIGPPSVVRRLVRVYSITRGMVTRGLEAQGRA